MIVVNFIGLKLGPRIVKNIDKTNPWTPDHGFLHTLWGQSEGDDSSSFYLDAWGLGGEQTARRDHAFVIFENQLFERCPTAFNNGFGWWFQVVPFEVSCSVVTFLNAPRVRFAHGQYSGTARQDSGWDPTHGCTEGEEPYWCVSRRQWGNDPFHSYDSVTTDNPSNPQQPIHSLCETHQEQVKKWSELGFFSEVHPTRSPQRFSDTHRENSRRSVWRAQLK